MTKHKLLKHVLPIILSAMLLFSVLPVSASANNESTDEVASKIVREVVELREESVKHFLCEDGSYIAVSYAEPVHYEKNGEWLEIDNTLVLSSENTYVPKSSDVAVSIPQSFSDGEQITATNNGHTISFGVASVNENVALSKTAAVKAVEALPSSIAADVSVDTLANAELNSTATVGKVDTAAQIEAYNSEKTTVDNQAGALVYDKIFPNADLEYIVTGNSIKENVVVYQPQTEYVYTFDMDFGGLTPVAEDDGSYRLIDSAKPDKTVFVLAAPYMYDANGEESYEVEMSLTENGDNYLLTLTADEAWINSSETTLPVTINQTDSYKFDDVFVMDGTLNHNTTKIKNELRVGRNLTNLTRTYIKISEPHNIPYGSVIDEAKLILTNKNYYQAPLQDNIDIELYDCSNVAAWSATSVTWNNQPFGNTAGSYNNYSTSCLDYIDATNNEGSNYEFDIKAAVENWLDTGINKGFMLASSDESSKTQIDFYSSRADESNPIIEISYTVPSLGISEWNLTVPDAATSSEITITTTKDWTITVDQPWISVSKTSGTGNSTFTISVTENTSVSQRTGYVTVWMGSVKIGEIKVEQSGSGAYLLLDETPIFIDYKTCSKTVTIDTNDSSWEIALEIWNNTDNAFVTVNIENNNNSADGWLEVNKNDDSIDLTVRNENTEAFARKARITVTAQSDTNTVSKVIQITQYDKVTWLFNTINEDGTLSAISSTENNHALATGAMELSYAAYNYPTDTGLPAIPGWFMGDVDYTAAELLINHGFVENQIQEYNYDVIYDEDSGEYERDPTAAGAHTIAYRNIEYVAQNENSTEEEVNYYGSNTGMVRSTVRGDLYDSVYTVNTNTNAVLHDLPLTEDEPIITRPLVVVTVRGSVTMDDWINNILTQLYPLDNRFVALKDKIADNLDSYISDLSNPIILVTGHCLGAAIANLLAAELSATLGVEYVYAYTFGTPQVVTESLGQEAISYTNIFNILNSNDVVTYVPTTWIPFTNFWSRHGIDIPLNMPYSDNLFTDPTGALCHSMAVYMAWMNNNPDMTHETIMEESEEARMRGILPWFVRIKCLVGVTIKDSEGNTIAYESQVDGKPYPEITDTGIVSWIDDAGAKVFFMPQYADAAKIEIDAYDYGTMTMSIGLLGAEETAETEETDETDETTTILNSITYNNVNLFPGRAFDVDLPEITEDFSMDDISLMEVEVNADGTRTDIGEITDLNPLLKSVTVKNPVVNYGTHTVIQVVTDKSVSKVQFIHDTTGATKTCAKDSALVVNVVEDGDNLIWTIQRVFTRGTHVYDVAVKVGYTWYRTENVFEITIN